MDRQEPSGGKAVRQAGYVTVVTVRSTKPAVAGALSSLSGTAGLAEEQIAVRGPSLIYEIDNAKQASAPSWLAHPRVATTTSKGPEITRMSAKPRVTRASVYQLTSRRRLVQASTPVRK